jgi:hypothetical protein
MTADWWPAGRPEVGDLMAEDLATRAMPYIEAAVDALLNGETHLDAADDILRTACREVVWAIKLGRRVGRRVGRNVPTAVIAQALCKAADEAERLMPEQRLHLGAVVERRYAA